MARELVPEVKPTVCCACSQQCGVLIHVDGGRVTKITGDKQHPVSRGFICSKGTLAPELHYAPDRIHTPLKRIGARGSGKWCEIGWDEALDEIAEKLRILIDDHGPQTVAYSFGTMHGSDWGLGERFMNLLGSPNTVGQDKVCYGPNVLGESLTYGFGPTFFTAPVPGVTRCMIIWGMRPSASMPLLWSKIVAAHRQGAKLIVIDPERTREARQADLWLQSRPGGDTALALGLLHCVIAAKHYDANFVETQTVGFRELQQRVAAYTPSKVSELTWVPDAKIVEAARLFATHRPALVHGGNGLCQSGSMAVQSARAIACLVAISGNLDVNGGHQLAGPPRRIVANGDAVLAHALSAEQRSQRLGAETYPLLGSGFAPLDAAMRRAWYGKRNVLSWLTSAHEPSLWRAITTGEPYPVKALFVQQHAALGSAANARAAVEALGSARLELLVVHDLFMNPTTRLADYALPACHWLEKPFYSSAYGYLGFGGDYAEASHAPIPPEYEHRSDYDLWRDLGRRFGQGEHWPETAEGLFDSFLRPADLRFDALCARRGPCFGAEAGGTASDPPTGPRWYGTPSGKVELHSELIETLGGDPTPEYALPGIFQRDPQRYPLVLTTGGREIHGFHQNAQQMAAFRNQHPHPALRLHPDTAASLGICDGDWVRIETPVGSVTQQAHLTDLLHPRVVQADRWWYPERADDEQDPFGFAATNINFCSDDAPESCDAVMGSWLLRGLPCRLVTGA